MRNNNNCCADGMGGVESMDFKATLKDHLDAIQMKDLKRFTETVSKEDITLIMPNGKLITDYDAFYNLHQGWFSDEDWSLKYSVVKVIETTEICSALLSIEYSDCDEEGNPVFMTYYLNLVFRYVASKWLLVYDQNTIFEAE